MKTKLLFQGWVLSAPLSLTTLLAAEEDSRLGSQSPVAPPEAISFSQLGVKAGVDYKGEGLAVNSHRDWRAAALRFPTARGGGHARKGCG